MAEPVTCGRCHEEIRWGPRATSHGIANGWWHRGEADHIPLPGPETPRAVLDDLYVGLERRAIEKAAGRSPETNEDEEEGLDEIPPIEIPCHAIDPSSLPSRSGIRQTVNLVSKQGWELRRLTHARGPYMGARKCLGVSDTIVLGAGALAPSRRRVVASWRDGKFDFGYILDGQKLLGRVNATELKNFIKRESEGPS